MNNEQLIQTFIQNFTGEKRKEVEQFLRTLIDNQVSFTEAIRKTNREFNSTRQSVGDIAGSISGVLDSLTNSTRVVSEGRKSFRKLESIVRKIQDDQAGIYELSLKELKNTKTKAASEVQRLRSITRELELKTTKLTPAEDELLRISQAQFENQKAIIEVIDERLDREQKLESALGLTGAVLENLNKIGIRALGGIGVNLGTLQEAFDEAREAGRNAAKEIEALDDADQFSDLSKRIYTLGASLEGIGKGIFEAFNDPLSLGIGLFKTINEQVGALNAAQNKFRRLAGESASAIGQLNSRAVTAVDLLNKMDSITEQIGLQANLIFSSRQLVNIAEAQELLGLSAEQATNLAVASKLTDQTQENFNNSLLRGADAANRLFKTAVPAGVALREAANASADILLSLGMSPDRLGRASVAAKALGFDLRQLDNIANSLLDFESSIQNELEAQVLTGRQLNLSRAREFALINNIEGVASELAANSITASEFANMNRIQQEGIAKAIGLTREELAKSLIQQSLASSLTDSQRASILGVNQAELERLDLQKSIEKSVQSITQALAGPLELLAGILEKSGAIYAIIGVGFAASITKFVVGIGSALFQVKAVKRQTDLLTASLIKAGLAAGTINIPGNVPLTKKGLPDMRTTAGRNFMASLGAGGAKRGGLSLLSRLGIGGLIAAGVIGAGTFAVKKAQEGGYGDDLVSKPGYGDRILFDKGTVTALNNNDTVVAGTNLGGGSRRTEQLLERLVSAVEKGGNVYIDGNKAGEALVLGTYKSS